MASKDFLSDRSAGARGKALENGTYGEMLAELLGGGRGARRKPRRAPSGPPSRGRPPGGDGGRGGLRGLVPRARSLYGRHNGRTYSARLMPSGRIRYRNKGYDTPGEAAKAVARGARGGLAFWKVKDKGGRLVSLASLGAGRNALGKVGRPLIGAGGRRSLRGLVPRARSLHAKYKGRPYSAKLMPSGKVMYKNRAYDTPGAAGRAITKYGCNGRTFWKVKDENGCLVPLAFLM